MNSKRLKLSMLLAVLTVTMIGSYFMLRLNNISDLVVIVITLVLVILCPLSIYLLLIRPRTLPKLFIYLSFILCLGATYFIIPPFQRDFLNKILVWLIPFVEISVIVLVIYSIVKSIISYKRINSNESYNFLEVTKMSLEPKLGSGFVLEAVLTEIGVFYYGILVWFKKPYIKENEVFTYHKTSQIKTIVIVFSFLIAIESVLFHLLIQLWSDIAAWVFTVLNIYALFYMVGLYNSSRFLPHVINRDKLTIRLGYQSSIELDISNIESIKDAKQVGFGDKIPKETYYSLLNIDTPQYELFLKEPVLMKGSYGKRRYVKTVIFRSDEPNRIINRINSILDHIPNETA
ncbi:hypothetical protein [Solibacillus sp. FSL K6-1126]|uniref:hypothetical protein n=1 Tax=Solibacillus sp. FSL K6-1126 TaxID=2921463 RepID=UPI0030FCECD9